MSCLDFLIPYSTSRAGQALQKTSVLNHQIVKSKNLQVKPVLPNQGTKKKKKKKSRLTVENLFGNALRQQYTNSTNAPFQKLTPPRVKQGADLSQELIFHPNEQAILIPSPKWCQ